MDSNHQPLVLETNILPIEILLQIKTWEPSLSQVSKHQTINNKNKTINLKIWKQTAELTGLEPVTCWLTVSCSDQLSYRTVICGTGKNRPSDRLDISGHSTNWALFHLRQVSQLTLKFKPCYTIYPISNVEKVRLELTTFWMQTRRSSQLSYNPKSRTYAAQTFKILSYYGKYINSWAITGIRTQMSCALNWQPFFTSKCVSTTSTIIASLICLILTGRISRTTW